MKPSAVAVDPGFAARGRWDEVMRLPAKSVIDVLTTDGAAHIGLLTRADGQTVKILFNGIEEHIPRGDVLRLDLLY